MAFEKLLSMFKEKPAAVAPEREDMPADAPARADAAPPAPRNEIDQLVAEQIAERAEAIMHESAPPASAASPVSAGADAPLDLDDLREAIVQKIRTVFDPEIPVNIYDLGLIYEIHLNDEREAKVIMTLTAPNCPSAGELPVEVEQKARSVPGVTNVEVELVWEPAWNKDMMSDVARLELGM